MEDRHEESEDQQSVEVEVVEDKTSESDAIDDHREQNDTNNNEIEVPRRTKIAEEVLATERSYVHNLELAIQNFLLPLRESIGTQDEVLNQNKINKIFCNLEEIYDINTRFCASLEERIDGNWNDDSQCIGDLFLEWIPSFVVYKPYVQGHQTSIDEIKKTEKRANWISFVQGVKEKGHTGRLDIYSFLIQPVQRMPRYELLLRDLIKITPENHPDYKNLNLALNQLGEMVASANEEMQKQEDYKKLQSIEKTVAGAQKPIAILGRRLIKEGVLTKVCRKIHKKRMFFLFDDSLLYGSILSTPLPGALGYYKYGRMLSLVDGKARVKEIRDTHELRNAFQIISSEKSFTVYAETVEDKQNWLKNLNAIFKGEAEIATSFIYNNSQYIANVPVQKDQVDDQEASGNKPISIEQSTIDTNEAPVWIPDSQTKICMMCGSHFSVVKRRHHCRNCGKVVCGSCSKQKAVLAHTSEKAEVRVCVICYEFIQLKREEEHKSSRGSAELEGSAYSPQSSYSSSSSSYTPTGSLGPASGGAVSSNGTAHALQPFNYFTGSGSLLDLKSIASKKQDGTAVGGVSPIKSPVLSRQSQNEKNGQGTLTRKPTFTENQPSGQLDTKKSPNQIRNDTIKATSTAPEKNPRKLTETGSRFNTYRRPSASDPADPEVKPLQPLPQVLPQNPPLPSTLKTRSNTTTSPQEEKVVPVAIHSKSPPPPRPPRSATLSFRGALPTVPTTTSNVNNTAKKSPPNPSPTSPPNNGTTVPQNRPLPPPRSTSMLSINNQQATQNRALPSRPMRPDRSGSITSPEQK